MFFFSRPLRTGLRDTSILKKTKPEMKKLLSFLILMVCFGWSSRAQIVHHNIDPDSTFGGGPALKYYVLQPPSVAQFHFFWSPDNKVYMQVHGTFGSGEVLMNAGYPAKLQPGANIAATGTWHEAAGPTGYLHADGNGNWRSDATDKYIGFRFKSSSGAWQYGWLKMTVAPGPASFTVKEWAYQSVAGVPIQAGQLATTGIGNLSNDPGIKLAVQGRTIQVLHGNEYAKYQYIITDAQGRNVQQGKVGAQEAIGVPGLASGVYVLRLLGNGYASRFKIALP